jgi:CheY-like chemotaxis protein
MSCILLIEDDTATRDALAGLLRAEGYSVACAVNGKDAIDQLRAGLVPCLILLDLMMPIMNGWEFREQQSQDPVLAQIPFALLSAHWDGAEELAAKAVAQLPKPLDFDELLPTVARYCSCASPES